MVDLTSPDGRVNVRLDDLSIPAYTVPNPYHQREGEIYDLGAQAQLIVARYRTGPEFVVNYSHARFCRNCSDAAADTGQKDLTVPDYIPSEGQPTQTSTGTSHTGVARPGHRLRLCTHGTARHHDIERKSARFRRWAAF